MDEADLAVIDQRLLAPWYGLDESAPSDSARQDVIALLAEVRRLREGALTAWRVAKLQRDWAEQAAVNSQRHLEALKAAGFMPELPDASKPNPLCPVRSPDNAQLK